MKKFLIILSSVVAFLIISLYLFFLFGIPNLINPNDYKTEVQKAAKEQAGINIDYSTAKIITTPNIQGGILVKDFTATLEDKSELAKFSEAEVKIKLVPLLFKKIKLSSFSLKKPQVFINKLKNGKLNIDALIQPQKEEKQDFEVVLNKSNIKVVDYNINFNDAYSKKLKNINIKGEELNIKGDKTKINTNIYIDNSSHINILGDINSIKKAKYDIKVQSSAIDLAKIKEIALIASEIAKSKNDDLKDINIKGSLLADFNIKSKGKSADYKGFIKINNASVSHKGISKPIKNINITADFDNDNISFKNSYGYLEDIKFDLSGKTSINGISDIKIALNKINLATIFKLVKTSPLLKDAASQLKDVSYINGSISTVVVLKGNLQDKNTFPVVDIDIINPTIKTKSLKQPIKITSGNIHINKEKVSINKIKSTLLNSPIVINGSITDFTGKNLQINVTAKGSLNASVVRNSLDYDARKSVIAKGVLPLIANLSGTPEAINIHVQSKMDNNNYLKPFKSLNSTNNLILDLKANTDTKSLTIEDLAIYSTQNFSKQGDFYTLKNAQKVLTLTGKVRNLDKNSQIIDNIKISTPNGINIALLEPKNTTLKLNTNVTVNGSSLKPEIKGNINISNLKSPENYLSLNNADIKLNKDISVSFTDLIVVDSHINGEAIAVMDFNPPFKIKNIEINAPYINNDKISQKFPPEVGNDTPVIIQNGKFFGKKIIANNLVNENVKFNFTLYNNLFKLKDLQASTAGGSITGIAETNLKTSALKANITASNMQLNPIITQVAKMPNEMFGTLSGNVNIATYGIKPEDINKNLIGTAVFNVQDGKLKRLGSFKYLLNAPDIIKTGLSLTQFGNISSSAANANTEDFKTLNGKIHFSNGVAYIEEIKSSGPNLSMYIKGNVAMNTNNANMLILGKTSDSVTKLFAPLRKLSFDNLLKRIPAKGFGLSVLEAFQTATAPQAPVSYPEVELIPELTTQNEAPGVFAVKIYGNMQSPKSVKSFKWIK